MVIQNVLKFALLAASTAVARPGVGHAPPLHPVKPRLVALQLTPSMISLSGPLDSQHLVVTGRYSDGSIADVTDQTRFRLLKPGFARFDKPCILTPVHNGSTAVVAHIGAVTTQVPLVVTRFDKLAPVSLAVDIEPMFTKIGCNQGSCHGQQNGKGGFKLSLRGYDANFDWEQMVKADASKRTDLKNPEKSLLLLKPTMQVAHGGGPRLEKGSPDYNLIVRWIKEGAVKPDEKAVRLNEIAVTPVERVMPRAGLSQRILVTARFSDGSTRDVTSIARYQSQNDAVATVDDAGVVTTKQSGESAVMVSYGGEVKVARFLVPYPTAPIAFEKLPRANYIDDLVYRKLSQMRLTPSPRASDSEFLRRVYIDMLATLPTPEETRVFLADHGNTKRSRLVDRLLDRPEYIDYRTLKLSDLLRVNGQYCSEEGADVYYRWIHDQVQKNVGYDQFVRELLVGRGSNFHVGPANYFKVASAPEELAETTAQSFLGVRIQCAKCHNHPFEKWKQKDYYGLAAFFARTSQKEGPEFGDTQIVVRHEGEVTHPRTKEVVPPKFLGGDRPAIQDDEDRRVSLAAWLTSRDNRDFARVEVNRIWAEYFGKGIVDAVDDFRISNPPSNAPLLDKLADDFIQHGFDVKYITRTIVNSETYQRSSTILPGNAKDVRDFARAYPRRLPAEPMLDAISQVTERPNHFGSYPSGWRAIQVRDSKIGSYFLSVFGRPKREILCACERSLQPNLSQSLHLINSGDLNDKIADDNGRVAHLMKQCEKLPSDKANAHITEELYLLTLCRFPTKPEAKRILDHVAEMKEPRKAFEDTLWALLNSEEFMLNH